MNYAYYPGCSLTTSAVEYDSSTRLLLDRLGVTLQDIKGWTCCGASVVEPVSRLLTYALPARNLALAQQQSLGNTNQVMTPCSACYLNLERVNQEAMSEAGTRAEVNEALSCEGLSYAGGMRVRHLLDVLAMDIGPARLAKAVTHSLEGLTVAPYYGCQILRPYDHFDNPERPVSMEGLLQATGAEIHQWDVGGRCCGASLMATHQAAALDAVRLLLIEAQGADCIVTVCPMCQMNLEAYQGRALSGSTARKISVLYLPQLLAVALGLSPKEAGIGKNLAVDGHLLARLRREAEAPA